MLKLLAKKIIIYYFLLILFIVSPAITYSQNKCGINISVFYAEIAKVFNLVNMGGWVVGIGNVGDMYGLETLFGHELNVVIRGHAGWVYQLPNDQNKLNEYAFSWVLNLSRINTSGQAIFFMPINEPNQTGTTDYLDPAGVTNYIASFKNWLAYFSNKLGGQRIHLLSPMLNQTHANFENYVLSLGGKDAFYSQFEGSSQNLYDFQDCGSLFCHSNPRMNASQYDQIYIPAPHYSIEAGILKISPPGYKDSEIAGLINGALNSQAGKGAPWRNTNFTMFAIFSHDPHRDNWDLFSAPLTAQAYYTNCTDIGTIFPDGYIHSFTDQLLQEIIIEIQQYGWTLYDCSTKAPVVSGTPLANLGPLVTDLDFCLNAGSGGPGNINPQVYQASRFVKTKQAAESISDPVLFTQGDQLPMQPGYQEVKGHWGADFSKFDEITIPWAQVVAKYLAGPFVYYSNTAIREAIDSKKIDNGSPLVFSTPKQLQDEMRYQYWLSCRIDDPCNDLLHCNREVIDKKCCLNEDCTEYFIPCVGPFSNECILSDGSEIRDVVPAPFPDEKDPSYQYWVEIPLQANPLTRVKGAIRAKTCNAESGAGVTTYTPWVSALKDLSKYLNTAHGPPEINPEELPITTPVGPIGQGEWQITEGSDPNSIKDDRYCNNGKEATYILSSQTEDSFNYKANVELGDNSTAGGLSFRITYDPNDPTYNDTRYQKYTAYNFSIRANEWNLWKTQTEDLCQMQYNGQQCLCLDEEFLCNDQPADVACDCTEKELYSLRNPYLLTEGDFNPSLSKGQPHLVEISVKNTATAVIISAMVDNILVLNSFEDKYHPFFNGGLGISMYNGDNADDPEAYTCFSEIQAATYQPLAKFKPYLVKILEKPLKKLVTAVKEKILIVSAKLFQPNPEKIAQATFNPQCLNIQITPKSLTNGKVQYTLCFPQTNSIITGCLGDPQFFGPGGTYVHNCIMPQNMGTTCFNSNTVPPYPDVSVDANGHFSIWAEVWGDGWGGTCDAGVCCNTRGYTVNCEGQYNINSGELVYFNCSGGGSGGEIQPQQCQPPPEPSYKPDGPEDPVIAEGHTIFIAGQYYLRGEWIFPDSSNGGKPYCEGLCADSYQQPVWTIVKYPFLEQTYNQLSNMSASLFAKFLPYTEKTDNPDDWDDEGESNISYCINQMEKLAGAHPEDPTWAPFCESFPANAGLHPYPGRNPKDGRPFDNEAVCSGRTRDLKTYPKFIGGVANAWQWLIAFLTPPPIEMTLPSQSANPSVQPSLSPQPSPSSSPFVSPMVSVSPEPSPISPPGPVPLPIPPGIIPGQCLEPQAYEINDPQNRNYVFANYAGNLTRDDNNSHADQPFKAVIIEWPDKNCRFVFSQEAGANSPYFEFSDNSGIKFQFFEAAYDSGELYNHYGRLTGNNKVTILSNYPNPVVIQWEYWNVNNDTGQRINHAVEYYTFYPCGIVAREMKFLETLGLNGFSLEPIEVSLMNPMGKQWSENIVKMVDSWNHPITILDAYSDDKREHYAIPTGLNSADIKEEGSSLTDLENSQGKILIFHLNQEDVFLSFGDRSGLNNERIVDLGESWSYNCFNHEIIGWTNSVWQTCTAEDFPIYPNSTSLIGINHPAENDSGGQHNFTLMGIRDNLSDDNLKQMARDWLEQTEFFPSD